VEEMKVIYTKFWLKSPVGWEQMENSIENNIKMDSGLNFLALY
jgi:hypothetical protein